MPEYYVGTLSGTSADGIDVVLVDFVDQRPRLIAANTYPIPEEVRSEIRALAAPTDNEVERLGRLDVIMGRLIAANIDELLSEAGIQSGDVVAVGSHGQTLRHRPDADPPFTLQVGDPNTIAARSGITTVADFRRIDMAYGGQGAPLAPLFHDVMFRQAGVDRVIVNLGGIANATILPRQPDAPVTGFDTGPANCLLDEWSSRILGAPRDDGGAWAASGTVLQPLLETLLEDAYFRRPAPKSTGRETFNLGWLESRAQVDGAAPQDIQATLVELTCVTIAKGIANESSRCDEVIACGGGVHNDYLMSRLSAHVGPAILCDTGNLGIHPDWIEGCAFAWLARQRLKNVRCNTTHVTGALQDATLGAIHLP